MKRKHLDIKAKENKIKSNISRKLAAVLITLSMSGIVAMFATACTNKGYESPVTPINPNPPITKPDPDKPNPPTPDDDEKKEEELKKFNATVKIADEFIANMQDKQNFTVAQTNMSIAYANGQTKVVAGNRVGDTTYYFTKDDVSYEVYQEEDAWKQREKANPAPITRVLNAVNQVTWEKLSGENLLGSKEINGHTLTLDVKLENGEASFTYSYNNDTQSGTISEVGTTSFEIPEITPEEKPIDWDNLTDAQLAEFTPVMVENIKKTLAKNIQRNIGNTGVLNNIFAIDFDGNNLILGINYTNNTNGNRIGLYSYPLITPPCYKNLYENDISAASSNPGSTLISLNYNAYSADDVPLVHQVFKKLTNQDSYLADFMLMTQVSGPIEDFGKTNTITLYKISENGITKLTTNARSDGNYTDPIGQAILAESAKEGLTYTTPVIENHNFTNKALYNFAGLEKTTSQESEN